MATKSRKVDAMEAIWNSAPVWRLRCWCALHITRKPVNCGTVTGWYFP